ncbi:MAG: hypothetical protein HOE90_09390 [Bacteriovoracaceae bacterium]|nr:hypothetical protein [Bacteriovoracaceae bacterium]
METIRKYRRLSWFDLVDHIESKLAEKPEKLIYIEFFDELHMRQLESLSEGANFKIKNLVKDILRQFSARMSADTTFAGENDLEVIKSMF